MTATRSKRQILEDAGYRYQFDRMIYVNRADKKIFSVESVDDHPEEWLAARIAERTEGNEWRFHFNSPPSEYVKNQLLSEFA